MDEFRPELDRDGKRLVADAEDASADTLPRLEHDEIDVVLVQYARCLETGYAGTENRDVGRSLPFRRHWSRSAGMKQTDHDRV